MIATGVLLRTLLGLRLLFFAEFFEAWIVPQRIEHRVEPQQRVSEWHARSRKMESQCESSSILLFSKSPFRQARNYLLAAFAAATILSKLGSPRKSSQHGFKRRSPYVAA